MKQLILSLVGALVFVCHCSSIIAQNIDSATLYSEFSRQSAILNSSTPDSQEYADAKQIMLKLFPQLQYNAAVCSKNGNNNNAIVFAKAYVDMAIMPQFKSMHLEKSADYATMTYFVASGYFNSKDYVQAAKYLQLYIDLGEQKNRSMVFLYLAKAYENINKKDKQFQILQLALKESPSDQNLLAMSINLCMENGWYAEAEQYIQKALSIHPNDSKLLSLYGQCYEGLGQYEKAVDIYAKMASQQKTISVYKHYALNLYNSAVQYQEKNAKLSEEYMQRAIPVLQQVVYNDPASVQYNTALAMCYLYTDQYNEMNIVNERLRSLGASEVGVNNVSQPLSAMTSEVKSPAKAHPVIASSETNPKTFSNESGKSNSGSDFNSYARTYIEKGIAQWQQKDPYETLEEYKLRVTEEARNEQVRVLMAEAKEEYVSKFASQIRKSDFSLQPYDAENRVFLIKSPYGDIVLPVPRENDEARMFASEWNTVTTSNEKLDIANNELVFRSVDFVTRKGKIYHYSDENMSRYEQVDINLQFDKIDYASIAESSAGGQKKHQVDVQKSSVTLGNSDVDINIPENKSNNEKTFAFLIGNEHYQQVASVPFAEHDAQVLASYCEQTLGIPNSNIRLYTDATFGKMLSCMRDIRSIADAYNGDVSIIFYYAGHGIPNEASKSAYLLPVDADGTQTETCYSIGRLYQELGKLNANQVVVLMDACFSGAQRGEGMIASARGVALKVKEDSPQGKMVVLSAATGDETAFPYEEKQHGMFTYYVLKHLQNTKGKTTLSKLADFVQKEVKQRSVVINKKSQTPTINVSVDAKDWERWSLR